ncbi:MAG: SOS response-associated peptidase [Chloroflexia bacterium]
MCGRYDLNATALAIAARFGLSARVEDGKGDADATSNIGMVWQPRYNIAPDQNNPVVVRDVQGHNHLELMRWGLVPAWSREAKVAYSTINARAETVASKPAFRKALVTQRCLVPATGYFEWAASERAGGKQPYRVQVTGDDNDEDQILAMAGLYDVWKGPYGEPLLTYTIITTEASPGIRGLHERMPVLLSREDEAVWLDPGMNETERLLNLLRPYPDEKISAYRVGRDVNSPANDRVELIRAA